MRVVSLLAAVIVLVIGLCNEANHFRRSSAFIGGSTPDASNAFC